MAAITRLSLTLDPMGISQFHLFFWNHKKDLNQIWQKCSLDGHIQDFGFCHWSETWQKCSIKNGPSRKTDNNVYTRQMAQINTIRFKPLLPISNKAGDYKKKKKYMPCDIPSRTYQHLKLLRASREYLFVKINCTHMYYLKKVLFLMVEFCILLARDKILISANPC